MRSVLTVIAVCLALSSLPMVVFGVVKNETVQFSMKLRAQHFRPDGRASVVMVKDGEVLRSGDRFQVLLRSQAETYIYVILYTSTRKAQLLHPLSMKSRDAKITAGETRVVPDRNASFSLDENTGYETIFAFASKQPITDIHELLRRIEAKSGTTRDILDILRQRTEMVSKVSFRHISNRPLVGVNVATMSLGGRLASDLDEGKDSNKKQEQAQAIRHRVIPENLDLEIKTGPNAGPNIFSAADPRQGDHPTVVVDEKGRVIDDGGAQRQAVNEQPLDPYANLLPGEDPVANEVMSDVGQKIASLLFPDEVRKTAGVKLKQSDLLAQSTAISTNQTDSGTPKVEDAAEPTLLAEMTGEETTQVEAEPTVGEIDQVEAEPAISEVKSPPETTEEIEHKRLPESKLKRGFWPFRSLAQVDDKDESSSSPDEPVPEQESDPTTDDDASSMLALLRNKREQDREPDTEKVTNKDNGSSNTEAINAVVLIVTVGSVGSGAILDREGHILTSWQVIKSSALATVIFKDSHTRLPSRDKVFKAKVIKTDRFSDLALLKLITVPESLKGFKLGLSNDIEIGEDVRAIAHTKKRNWTDANGKLVKFRPRYSWYTGSDVIHNANLIQTSSTIDSDILVGGPILNQNMELIGIHTIHAKASKQYYSVGVDTIHSFLEDDSFL